MSEYQVLAETVLGPYAKEISEMLRQSAKAGLSLSGRAVLLVDLGCRPSSEVIDRFRNMEFLSQREVANFLHTDRGILTLASRDIANHLLEAVVTRSALARVGRASLLFPEDGVCVFAIVMARVEVLALHRDGTRARVVLGGQQGGREVRACEECEVSGATKASRGTSGLVADHAGLSSDYLDYMEDLYAAVPAALEAGYSPKNLALVVTGPDWDGYNLFKLQLRGELADITYATRECGNGLVTPCTRTGIGTVLPILLDIVHDRLEVLLERLKEYPIGSVPVVFLLDVKPFAAVLPADGAHAWGVS